MRKYRKLNSVSTMSTNYKIWIEKYLSTVVKVAFWIGSVFKHFEPEFLEILSQDFILQHQPAGACSTDWVLFAYGNGWSAHVNNHNSSKTQSSARSNLMHTNTDTPKSANWIFKCSHIKHRMRRNRMSLVILFYLLWGTYIREYIAPANTRGYNK